MSFLHIAKRPGFKTKTTPLGTLIIPKNTKWKWLDDERFCRSVLVDEEDNILSMGMPKFGNYEEPSFEKDQQLINQDILSEKELWFSEKVDGTLVIRSVIEGEVIFRTRGTHDCGVYRDVIVSTVSEKYPQLKNQEFMPEHSLWFEFVSKQPEYQVLLKHPENDLVFLGGVKHLDLQLISFTESQNIAKEYNLKLTKLHQLPSSLKQLAKIVKKWPDREGIVVRSHDGQTLLKFKSASYLALHSLRSELNYEKIYSLIEENQLTEAGQVEEYLLAKGIDWEIFSDKMEYIENVISIRKQAKETIDILDQWVLQECIKHPGKKQEVVKRIHTDLPSTEHQAALLLLDGQDGAVKVLEKELLKASQTACNEA